MDNEDRTIVRPPPPKFTMRCVSGATFGKKYPLSGTMIIGRHEDCDVVIPSDEVSRQHTKLTVSGSGIQVEDLDSANGTFIDGQQVTKGIIQPDQELGLDKVRFLIQATGAAGNKPWTEKPPAAAPLPEEPPSTGGKAVYIVMAVIVLGAAGAYFALAM